MGQQAAATLALAGALAVAGFAWLALAMDVHWHQVHGSRAPARLARQALRVLGITGLLASAVLCFVADRPSMAILVWVLFLAVSAGAVSLALAWRPRLLRYVWPVNAARPSADR